MTSEELKVKYEAAQERVEKRKNIIAKACNKLGIGFKYLMDDYYNYIKANNVKDFLKSKQAEYIASKYIDMDDIEYGSPEEAIVEGLSKLFDLEKVANNWYVKFSIEKNKEAAPKIKVLQDFLDDWGEKAKRYYIDNAELYVKRLNEVHDFMYDIIERYKYCDAPYDKRKDVIAEFNSRVMDRYNLRKKGRIFGAITPNDIASASIDKLSLELARVRFITDDTSWQFCFDDSCKVGEYKLVGFNDEELDKIIEREKKRKYEDLCNRIGAVVGDITDVSGLFIGNKNGELNGIVKGTNGVAKVETIGAGGYNIQIFHYRVLVNKIR